jgi:CRP/FNR family transcriptional regulator
MSTYRYISPSAAKIIAPIACHNCPIKHCCLPLGLDRSDLEQFEHIIKQRKPLHKNEYLFRPVDPMQQLFTVLSGTLKHCYLDVEGNERISDFYLPGELVGLDSIGADHYRGYAQALDTTTVCSIPLHQLEELAGRFPHIRQRLLNLLSRQIHYSHQKLNHSRENAEQRLTAFLLDLSARYGKCGRSATRFSLPMSRGEIANYLGLTGETISRLLSRYRQQGLIELQGREIQLLNLPAQTVILSSNPLPAKHCA